MEPEFSADAQLKNFKTAHPQSTFIVSVFIFLTGILLFHGSPVFGFPLNLPFSENAKPSTAKILFLGDMMFDRGIRAQISAHGFEYIFGTATTTIAAHDITVANLEGPITSSNSLTYVSNGAGGKTAIPGFQFTFPLGTALALKNAGIDIVSLANNHTNNFAQTGLDETRTELTKANVGYFGSPNNSNSFMATSTCIGNTDATKSSTNENGDSNAQKICIGLIGWHEFASAGKDDSTVFTSIKALRPSVDYLVVFPHWGEEYEAKPTTDQRAKAHAWLDAGADAIIGAHPHVVETIEQYKGKPIFYSLGNFIFDQYFSFDTTHGIGVSIELTKNKVVSDDVVASATGSAAQIEATYTLIPFSSVGSYVSVPDAASAERLYNSIKTASDTGINSWLKFR